jgi:adenylate cyclase
VAAKKCGAPPAGPPRTPNCVAAVRKQTRARSQHYADSAARRLRVLNINAWMAVSVCGTYGLLGLFAGAGASTPQLIDLAAATIFAAVPLLHRFGELVAPLTFVCASYVSIVAITWNVGTGNGLQFFLLVTACLVVLQLGIEHIVLASMLASVAAGLVIALEFSVPRDTGVEPPWAMSLGFVIAAVSACAVMEAEYERSEALLSNMLPASIAARLKDPERKVIADKYDDASVLFADIAGFTERASDTEPADLVTFLDRLYTEFDALVDKHGLEKIKVSGDNYMVVSGVPWSRHDHVEALADLALDMADAVAGLQDPHGRAVPLRIGLASGPVVAGVVGSRRFFYDVWGDAVNVASRMESTDTEGRIQVPQVVYERLRHNFILHERGDVEVKGKGVMRTWYLVGRRSQAGAGRLAAEAARSAGV